jgi:hypothetical protein
METDQATFADGYSRQGPGASLALRATDVALPPTAREAAAR